MVLTCLGGSWEQLAQLGMEETFCTPMAQGGVTLGTLPGGVFGAGSSEATSDVLNLRSTEQRPGGGSAVSPGLCSALCLCSVPRAVQCPQIMKPAQHREAAPQHP